MPRRGGHVGPSAWKAFLRRKGCPLWLDDMVDQLQCDECLSRFAAVGRLTEQMSNNRTYVPSTDAFIEANFGDMASTHAEAAMVGH